MSTEKMREEKGFESWCIVEIMGHQQLAGLVSEQVIAGQPFVRVDVPACEEDGRPVVPAYTKFLGGSSIYALTPVAEEVARAAVRALQKKPISIYMPELAPRPPAGTRALIGPDEDDAPDFDDGGPDPGALPGQ